MKRAKQERHGRSPPALRIHAGVSRLPCLDRGLIAAPGTPASHLPCSREETSPRWSRPWRHVLGLLLVFLHNYSYQEIVL